MSDMGDPSRHLPAGSARRGPFAVEVTPRRAGWTYCSLRVLDLTETPTVTFATGEEEMLVLPLAGSCEVTCDDVRISLTGRAGVFSRVSDFAYLPRDTQVTISGHGRVALPGARATRRLSPRYGPADKVPVELRGAGRASRQVNNFCSPEAFDTDKLVAVEVLTPGGNWSSYPPHKHDTCRRHASGRIEEAELEEIYYFEVAGEAGFGFQRVYSSGPDKPIDVLAEVRSGDVVLIPYGYHGPSMAAPGYDMYYLNVLAGPAGERTMAFCDDPAHAWIRGSWAAQRLDPRLPMTSPQERSA